ncbi:ATP-binding protein [uncultured Hoeflea sp.]|uniref:ATP-binding protein n=1 Tax=uncultured Hoeflea sp. TaxID=538666 RepID=UPI002623DA34|nr:ATP-binding protein [uncultured Hoeflea sp.]
MQAHHYPFIDLAVHDAVRERFAHGDAIAVLDPDLGRVLWANGAAADLFGFNTIYDVLEEGLAGQPVTVRQIASARSALERTGTPQSFTMRLASGFSRRMTPARLEYITLSDGAEALLIASQAGSVPAPGARARQVISGFEGTGTHVAVLDADGAVLAASRTFGDIGLADADIAQMIADVATEDDRLVKRMVNAGAGAMPAAIGRLTDDPLLHLLFAVEPMPEEPAVEPAGASAIATVSASEAGADEDIDAGHGDAPGSEDDTRRDTGIAADLDDGPDSVTETSADADLEDAGAAMTPETDGESEIRAEDAGPDDLDDEDSGADDSVQRIDIEQVRRELSVRGVLPSDATSEPAETADSTGTSVPPPFAEARGLEVPEDAPQAVDSEATAEQLDSPRGDAPGQSTEDLQAEAERTAAAHPAEGPEFVFDPAARPTRFVWKIDRDGAFSEVSPEFAAAVGPHAADIVGRSFPDLARVFNLDPDHVIADLLSRRDTWSGKTVYWPIQGTDLVTPVDLAALPTYTRDRQFDGFRGFGIVRSGETRKDPEALGLALVPGSISSRSEPVGDADGPDGGADGDVSARDEVSDAALEAMEAEQDAADLARLDGAEASDFEPDAAGETDDAGPDNASDDPFHGERPAIRLVETPMRRDSDKVIRLETRRAKPSRDSLSPGEQAAFREIGTRLNEATESDAGSNPDTGDVTGSGAEPHETSSPMPEDQQPFGQRPPSPGDAPADHRDIEVRFDSETPADADLAAETDDTATAEQEVSDTPASLLDEAASDDGVSGDDISARDATPDAPAADAAEAEDEPGATDGASTVPDGQPLPSAFALPARRVMPSGPDPDLIDAIPSALLVHAGDALIHANPEFFQLTGYASLNDLALAGGLDALLDRPEDEDGPEDYSDAGTETDAGDGALTLRRSDGGELSVQAQLRSINWGDGQALLLALTPIADPAAAPAEIAPAETITDPDPDAESRADALAVEARDLRSILETATDGVVVLGHDGAIRSMNGSASALFNYDEADALGQPFAMLFAHESQRAVMDYVSGLADHGVSSVLNDGREVIGREAGGGFLPLFMTIGRLSGSDGYCAVLRDITQWKRTEDELRTAKRAAETANSHKSDFLARVSHEIRTPLNAIIGFSEMMVEERFGPIGSPRYLEYAHDIGNSGKHVLDIVNDLLDISKIEAGQVDMEFIAVSLNDHLAESVSLLQPMANSQRVIIRTSLSASVPEVVADQRSVKQIALNLLSNAIRYTPSGGQIVVSTSYETAGNVVIRIRDTGVGMNRKELEQAMKPFGQVGPGPRQRGEGTGLGLPLTKAMVEANRAQFDIVSAPGEGTLVSISFPPQRVLAD